MFIYFLPNQRGIASAKTLPACLAHLVGAPGLRFQGVSKGPDGAPGMICTYGDKSAAFNAQAQTWARMAGESAWIGFDTLPLPHDLMREDLRAGLALTLADGNPWMVPFARLMTGDGYETALPRKRRLGADGRWVADEVVAQYRALWEAACRWYEKKYGLMVALANLGGGELVYGIQEETGDAILALATNYRVGPMECELLGLLDDPAVEAILDTIADIASFDVLSAKKAVAADTGPVPAA